MAPLPQRRSFTPGGLQFAWDSTSIKLLKECPRKYQYSILWAYTAHAESVHLTFGLHYHKGLEIYDHMRAEGLSHDEAQLEMVCQMLKATWKWRSNDPNKNRFTLIRSLVWYTEEFAKDPFRTIQLANGKPAVELSFRFDLDMETPDGTPYLYCGHLDRVAALEDEVFILDRKTSKNTINSSFFDKFNPNNQMSGYFAAGRIALAQPIKAIVIDATQVAVGFNRFSRGMTERTQDQLDEWLDTTKFFIRMAEGYTARDFWPMNEASCDNYGGCAFRSVCQKAPRLRRTWLDADYARRVWDPLQIRGDI